MCIRDRPNEAEDAFFKGRNWQDQIANIRPDEKLRIEDIYKQDSELYDWWMRIDRKHNQR